MAGKAGERDRLLRLYQSTGDEDYRRAADCLTNAPQRQRGRPESAWPEARARLKRMNVMLLRDAAANVHDAAFREVDNHGRGAHASQEAAVTYLRKRYRESEKVTFDWLKGVIDAHNARVGRK
jgi:hypothetical protein